MVPLARRVEIALSKSKIFLMLFGALIFVSIGIWFVIAPPVIKNPFWGNPTKIAIVGYAAILFFGLCAFFILRKLSDNKPGLIIDDKGLIDNSSGLSAGYVPWSDIEEISVIEIQGQQLIMLHVINPQKYIDSQKNALKRKGMELNHKMYRTPIFITTNGLKISFDKLFALLTDQLKESRHLPLSQ